MFGKSLVLMIWFFFSLVYSMFFYCFFRKEVYHFYQKSSFYRRILHIYYEYLAKCNFETYKTSE